MQPSQLSNLGANERLTAQDVQVAAQRLPTTAQVFAQINRVLDDPDASLEDVANLVRLEPVLSFRVLQLSNGAFYGFRTPCSDLNEAITRLGFREINRLVGMVTAQHLCASYLSVYGIQGDRFWSDSICSALACEWFAEHHAFGDTRTAYTVGLLRSVGKVVIERILAEHPPLWRGYAETGNGRPLLEWEKETFGLTSIDASVQLMQSWKMPQLILDAVGSYCTPEGDEPLPYLMNMGSVAAAQICGALPGEEHYWNKSEPVFKILEFPPEMMTVCTREVEETFNRVKRAVMA